MIKTSLLDPPVNKRTAQNILKVNILETNDTYYSSSIHVYTDVSAFKVKTCVGFGGYLKFSANSQFEFNDSFGTFCSNFEAEISPIKTAVEITHTSYENRERLPSNLVIFTDLQSSLVIQTQILFH